MALTLASAADLLKEHHLLREIIQGDVWTDDPAHIASADEPFAGITYDTRKVTPGTLLCCKGRFKAEYSVSATKPAWPHTWPKPSTQPQPPPPA